MMLIVVDRKPVYRMHVQFCRIAILFFTGQDMLFPIL
jgi:hypothetical protein